MNFLRLFTTIIPLIVVINFSDKYSQDNISGYYTIQNVTSGPDFKNKAYFAKIFSSTDNKALTQAYNIGSKTVKYDKKFNNYYAKAQTSKSFIAITGDSSYQKKVTKSMNKAYKQGSNSYKIITDNNSIIYGIYKKNIERLLTDTLPHYSVLNQLFSQTKASFSNSQTFVKKAESSANSLESRYFAYMQADTIQQNLLRMQETIFGIIMRDPQIDPLKFYPEKAKNTVGDTTKTNPLNVTNNIDNTPIARYNPDLDNNLYESIKNIILDTINVSQTEVDLIKKFEGKETTANALFYETTFMQFEADSLRVLAAKAVTATEREYCNQSAERTEGEIFVKLERAINLHIAANTEYFKIYQAHLKEFSKSESSDAKNWIAKATMYYGNALLLIQNAKKNPFVSDRFIELSRSNELLLLALQSMENAYAIYLRLSVSDFTYISFTNTETKFEVNPVIPKQDPITNTKTNTNPGEKEKKTGKTHLADKNYTAVSTWFYTRKDQRLREYSHANSTIFTIKTGIFKEMLEPVEITPIEIIICEKLKNFDYMRYYAGEFYTHEAAEKALEIIKKAGYKNSEIVAFVNGKRTSYNSVKNKINKDKVYFEKKNIELSLLNEKSESKLTTDSDISNDLVFTKNSENNVPKLTTIKGTFFAVQFATLKDLAPTDDFKPLTHVYFDKMAENTYRYYTGISKTPEEANNQLEIIKKLGYTDAYVVAYKDNKRISVKTTDVVTNNTNEKNNQPVFSVQIGAFKSDVSPEMEKSFNKIKAKYPVSTSISGGYTIYAVGNCTTIEQAKEIQKWLNAQGYKENFIVAFKSGKKIPVSEALNYSN